MKIIITAGGTTEKIDCIRGIANISTGKLGSLIANAFSALPEVEEIYYVCNNTAMLPQSKKAKVLYVSSVRTLEMTLKSIFSQTNIDIIVHSMAVSDYRVKSVTSASNIANRMVSQHERLKKIYKKNVEAIVTSLLSESESVIDGNSKISSNIDNMLLVMERTPKVISMFQKIAPCSILVGFKLLDNVPQKTLIDTAFHILQENNCSFVLANDLCEIDKENHIGYLIDSDKKYKRFITKEEIANAIVTATIEKGRNLQ